MKDILDLPPQKATHRVFYGAGPQQFGDLWLPPGVDRPRLLIALHGGFWRARYDLEHLSHLCAAMAALGLAVWSLEYRRVGHSGGGFPGTMLDVAQGVDFLPTLSRTFGLDTRQPVVTGHSAGGQLALWLAGRERLPERSPLFSKRPLTLGAVVALAPVADLQHAFEEKLGNGIVETFLGGVPHALPARYAEASPVQLLPVDAQELLIHGESDAEVPVAQSERFVECARRSHSRARLLSLPGTGHYELIDPRQPAFADVRSGILGLL